MTLRVWGTRYWPPGPAARPLAELDALQEDGTLERSCRFPVGDAPRSPAEAAQQLFCGGDAEPGCPYCREHVRVAWTGRPAAEAEALARLVRREAA